MKQIALTLALILLLTGGLVLLHRNDQQARDTIRKHHLADIEQSLYFVHQTKNTFPPYDQPTWCGVLSDPKNSAVKAQVEAALRSQNDMYKNLAKPFPTDPLADQSPRIALATWGQPKPVADYFYWKRSPSTFELYATLEADKTSDRNSINCPNATPTYYDYGIASINREPK